MKIQRLMFKENLRAAGLVTLLGLASCAIDNDIPYPLVEGTISEIVTEGLRASEDGTVASGVDIDRSARTVTLYVNDSVDVSRLRLTRLILDPRDATIELDSARCDDKEKFPFHDFASLDSLSLSANTRLDLSTPLELNVRTYQDNPWTLTVRQIVDRTVDVDGMVDHLVAKLQPASLPQQEIRQLILERWPAFSKFNFHANTTDAKAVWIFDSLQKSRDALLSGKRIVKGHTAHIRQGLGSHRANVNASHLFKFLCS